MSCPTFWASLCGWTPGPGEVTLSFGLGGGGGAGRGLEGAGGILLGFLSCPRASRCAGLGGTADVKIQPGQEEQIKRRSICLHHICFSLQHINNIHQVTRRNLNEKTSIAELACVGPVCFLKKTMKRQNPEAKPT